MVALVVPWRMLAIFTLYEMIYVWGTISAFIRPTRMLPCTAFFNNGMDKLPWTSFISDLHTKPRMISSSFPG